ncbi:MAG: phosphomannomutase [Rickettsiales bacterium]|jgi:phosphomannomutase
MHKFHNSVLRAYDIRGIIDETLSNKDAYYIGRSFAQFLNGEDKNKVVVGYDGRLSSPELREHLVQGLIDSGIDVLEVGLCPTPMLYFGVYHLEADAGIMITGSHNPANHNGFKFLLKDRPFYGDDILELGEIAKVGNFPQGSGDVNYANIMDHYVDYLANDCNIESDCGLLDELDGFLNDEKKQLKISWDMGNGSSGVVVRKLTNKLKAKHYLLFEEIDGNFPNHHPDPTVEANLEDLKKSVLENKCDIGIAFDGDGDRVGIVDNEGEVLWGDQLMCLFARDVLKDHPGATIIADVKASQVLFDEIKKAGGVPLMWKTGHSLIKAKMKEVKSPLAGEMSGHIFFADRYFGFDDGIYAAVRIINIILESGKSLSEIKKSLPKTFSTTEIRIDCTEEEKFKIIETIQKQLKEKGVEFNDIDGIRVQNLNGWWLLRASNTSAVLVARCEALTLENLNNLKKDLRSHLSLNEVSIPQELL